MIFIARIQYSIKALLAVEEIMYPALEPACDVGHISKLLDNSKEVVSCDLIERIFLNQF